MITTLKKTVIVLLTLIFVAALVVYSVLRASLPQLDGKVTATAIDSPVSIERDALGTATVTADNRIDLAFGLGFAHAQDRYFQMDLLRRASAGELSELVGKAALEVDKSRRFHQFRKRSQQILAQLPAQQLTILERYTEGVNAGLAEMGAKPFEYYLLGQQPLPWRAEDSLLVSFSMYVDLQYGQVRRDLTLTRIAEHFGQDMVDFLLQPSADQAALDGSKLPIGDNVIPRLSKEQVSDLAHYNIVEPPEIGSNNWAVTGQLTESGHAMLADDMHLSLRVPVIWYRSQLNYPEGDQQVQVTGVSLPGTPAVIVGTNGKVAWGFTNANFDNVDWVRLPEGYATRIEQEKIGTGDAEVTFDIEMTDIGPVKRIDGQAYALAWVAHQLYAVDMELMAMEQVSSVQEAMVKATTFGMPLQNMMLADNAGNAGWKPTGAVTARPVPGNTAIDLADYSALWSQDEVNLPAVLNPEHGRLWTANSRVISTQDLPRFGNGGYANPARAEQIRMRLFEQDQFSEADFYRIQLDNEARFLTPWHGLLLDQLKQHPSEFALSIEALENWQRCACAESVGYTLVDVFRGMLIDRILSPLENKLQAEELTLSPVLRHVEPAIWQIIEQQPEDWLPVQHANWHDFMVAVYRDMLQMFAQRYGKPFAETQQELAWGEFNKLAIKHPFAGQIPVLGKYLNMPEYPGFGDGHMPAVQNSGFGASQRLFVQPGLEQQGILTVPGGQSGHPLSDFYKAGFAEYAEHQSTPLLPGEAKHSLVLEPAP